VSRDLAVLWVPGFVAGLACASVPDARPAETDACASLAGAYAAAVAEAQSCGDGGPCTALRGSRLDDPCHCLVRVDAARLTALDDLGNQWTAQGCGPRGACNRACRAPSP